MSYDGPERRSGKDRRVSDRRVCQRREVERRTNGIHYEFLLTGKAVRRSGLDRRRGERRQGERRQAQRRLSQAIASIMNMKSMKVE